MARRKTNPDFLIGVPELLLLQLLSRKPMHGYAVVQAITDATSGELQFGEGSIYPILHRLESEKKLATQHVEHNGRQRVIYRTTKKGLTQLAESHSTWQKITSAVSAVLDGPDGLRAKRIARGHGSNSLA